MNVTKRSDIPNAKYYVLSNDRFMSGWGPARGMINTVVLPCDSWNEARYVRDYADSRGDQKYVRIVCNKPRMKSHVLYSLHDKSDYSTWYGGYASGGVYAES